MMRRDATGTSEGFTTSFFHIVQNNFFALVRWKETQKGLALQGKTTKEMTLNKAAGRNGKRQKSSASYQKINPENSIWQW